MKVPVKAKAGVKGWAKQSRIDRLRHIRDNVGFHTTHTMLSLTFFLLLPEMNTPNMRLNVKWTQ